MLGENCGNGAVAARLEGRRRPGATLELFHLAEPGLVECRQLGPGRLEAPPTLSTLTWILHNLCLLLFHLKVHWQFLHGLRGSFSPRLWSLELDVRYRLEAGGFHLF